jgi:hypothetical protein
MLSDIKPSRDSPVVEEQGLLVLLETINQLDGAFDREPRSYRIKGRYCSGAIFHAVGTSFAHMMC